MTRVRPTGIPAAACSAAALSVASHGAFTVNTSTIAGAAGASGSITLDHNGPYGGLSGKAVAVEPATGFTFDTTMVPKFN